MQIGIYDHIIGVAAHPEHVETCPERSLRWVGGYTVTLIGALRWFVKTDSE